MGESSPRQRSFLNLHEFLQKDAQICPDSPDKPEVPGGQLPDFTRFLQVLGKKTSSGDVYTQFLPMSARNS